MGAFLLFSKGRLDLELAAVERHYNRRGFGTPKQLVLAGLELWLWPKQRVAGVRCCLEGEQCSAFAVGTLVYRQRKPDESLRLLAEDYRSSSVAWDELLGSFCAGFWRDGKLTLLTDRLDCQPVFVDEKFEVASSSFLGLLMALPGRHRLNPLGFAEKVATGYIVGPDTLVEGISRTTWQMQEGWKGRCWDFAKKPPRTFMASEIDQDRCICENTQLSAIEGYLTSVRALAQDFPAVLGLSTGYDSRLLFALACRMGFPLAVQTHATKGVHDFDLRVVRDLAARKRLPLVTVSTRPMGELPPDEFAAVLRDCVDFFDGRCSHNMGAFSETYTRQYSIASLGDFRLRLNGLGGEIFRNYYFDSPGLVDFRPWLERHVYYPPARKVIGNRVLWEEMHQRKVAKMSAELGLDLTAPADALVRKRYYSEIRMPQCDGANNNAHNQIAYYLTPFIDWCVIRTGYQAVPHLGMSGRFQAALIAKADPEVASAPSHYGYTLTDEPWRHRLKIWIKCMLPDSFWLARRERQIRRGSSGATNLEQYQMMRRHYPALQQVEDAFRSCVPQYSWEDAQRDYAQGPTLVFMATWLMAYEDKLAFD